MREVFNHRPYQVPMQDHLEEHPAAALWAGVGLGKTGICSTAIARSLDACETNRWVIAAPLKVCQTTWRAEFEKWSHLHAVRPLFLNDRKPKERERFLANGLKGAEVVVINNELVPWLVRYYATQLKHRNKAKRVLPWDGLAIDESSKYKGSNSTGFAALRRVTPAMRRVIELTGSPAAQNLSGLWSQLFLLDQGKRLCPTVTAFRETWFDLDFNGFDYELKEGAEAAIRGRVQDICYSAIAADLLGFEEPLINVKRVPLSDATRAAYKKLAKESFMEFPEGSVSAVNAGVLTGKLGQAANGAVYVDNTNTRWHELHNEKLDALEDYIDEQQGSPALLAYYFKSDQVRIRDRLGSRVEFYDASDAQKARWLAGRIPMLAIHPSSAAHGVDGLQGVSTSVCWYSLPWSYEAFEQLNGRIIGARQMGTPMEGRRGVATLLVAEGTVDEKAHWALTQRDKDQKNFLRAIEQHRRETT